MPHSLRSDALYFCAVTEVIVMKNATKKSADHILEVLVLELTVLAGTLQLHLHLRDLGRQRGDLLGEGVDRGREVRDLGLHLLDVALLHLLSHLVLVESLNAEILHLDVVGLLLLQVGDLRNMGNSRTLKLTNSL